MIKKPKNGQFTCYCFKCIHWTHTRDIGCAHEGICNAIEDEPTIQDAYDKPCGLWTTDKSEQWTTIDERDKRR